MKYLLKNKTTGEEHLCEKVVIDKFEYYVTDEKVKHNNYYISNGTIYKSGNSQHELNTPKWFGGKIIATNNPNIELPQVIDEIWEQAIEISQEADPIPSDENDLIYLATAWCDGYSKAKEETPFSEQDMIDFGKYLAAQTDEDGQIMNPNFIHNKILFISEKELFEIWKQQRPKTIWYE